MYNFYIQYPSVNYLKEEMMKLSAPTQTVWWISLVLGALGVLLFLKIIKIAVLAPYTFWLVAAGLALLLLATALKKL